jgi:hypothetical protein
MLVKEHVKWLNGVVWHKTSITFRFRVGKSEVRTFVACWDVNIPVMQSDSSNMNEI